MKENDRVRLTVDKEKYTKEGFYKGMDGIICDPRKIYGQWLVCFWRDDIEIEYVEVKEEDLEVIWDSPVREVGITVLFLSNKEKYIVQGITNGMFGVIVAQCEDKDYWDVKFVTADGTEKFVSVYYNDMLPIRDDELEAYKKEVAKELKRRQNS